MNRGKKGIAQEHVEDVLMNGLGNVVRLLFVREQKGLPLSDKSQGILEDHISRLQKYIRSAQQGTVTVIGEDGVIVTATGVSVQPLVNRRDVQKAIGRELKFGDEVELNFNAKNHYHKSGTLKIE